MAAKEGVSMRDRADKCMLKAATQILLLLMRHMQTVLIDDFYNLNLT